MVISFCGHSKYVVRSSDEVQILSLLEREVGDCPCDFFLGEYGNFDRFAYMCAKKFKRSHPNAQLVFVSPYPCMTERRTGSYDEKEAFDLVLCPALEHVPPKYAIWHRNKWIVDQTDLLVAYVAREYGGAYSMYRYALRRGKRIYNLAAP